MHPPGLLSVAVAAGENWARSINLDVGRDRPCLDLAFALAAANWVALLLFTLQGQTSDVRIVLSSQLTLLGSELFFLLAAGRWRRFERRWFFAHVVAIGAYGLLVAGGLFGLLRSLFAPFALVCVNAVFVAMLLLTLGLQAWKRGRGPAWGVLLVALSVCAVLVNNLRWPEAASAHLFALQPLVGVQLLLLWLLIRRGKHLAARRDDDAAAAHTQLAQDLHDGVGYHLSSIIAALDSGTEQQRATAASLQQCLLELRMLVDGTVTHETVLGHLANLRYRTQPLLDAAGVALHWDVPAPQELEHLRGDSAVQVLRIAQEALANAIRHSGARAIMVRCHVARPPNELVLEIRDDGQGLPSCSDARRDATGSTVCGHGLRGMRTRAKRLGGRLRIDSAPEHGTRVQLRLPLESFRFSRRL